MMSAILCCRRRRCSGVLSAAAVLVRDAVQLDSQRLPGGRVVLVQRRIRVRRLRQQAGQRDRPVVHVPRQQNLVPGHRRLPLYVTPVDIE